MAPGHEINEHDFPPELLSDSASNSSKSQNWQAELRQSIKQLLSAQTPNLLHVTQQEVERILIDEALAATGGKKAESAELLGCGRNTLTRKLKELDLG